MTLLQKIGSVVLRIIGIASGALPLLQQVSPSAAKEVLAVKDKLDQGLSVIQTMEQVFTAAGLQKAGSSKLNAAKPFIASLLQNTEALVGKKPKDEAKFESAVAAITSGFADLMNSYGD